MQHSLLTLAAGTFVQKPVVALPISERCLTSIPYQMQVFLGAAFCRVGSNLSLALTEL